jgi:hypothetical protein
VIATDPALAVEQRLRENPRTINLDLLEEFDAGNSGHLGGSPAKPPVESPVNQQNYGLW